MSESREGFWGSVKNALGFAKPEQPLPKPNVPGVGTESGSTITVYPSVAEQAKRDEDIKDAQELTFNAAAANKKEATDIGLKNLDELKAEPIGGHPETYRKVASRTKPPTTSTSVKRTA